jgi:hypothetical protein
VRLSPEKEKKRVEFVLVFAFLPPVASKHAQRGGAHFSKTKMEISLYKSFLPELAEIIEDSTIKWNRRRGWGQLLEGDH